MSHLNFYGIPSDVGTVYSNLETGGWTGASRTLHYISNGTSYSLPLISSDGVVTKGGNVYKYDSSKKTIHCYYNGILHVPNIVSTSSVPITVTIEIDFTYVSGSAGSYDQCGEIYGWVNYRRNYKFKTNVTSTAKTVSSWSVKLNGPIQIKHDSSAGSTGWSTIFNKGTVSTNTSTPSYTWGGAFRTDYQNPGAFDLYIDTYSTENAMTATVNFSDGTSGTMTFDMSFIRIDDWFQHSGSESQIISGNAK